jgi:hypothetical protein
VRPPGKLATLASQFRLESLICPKQTLERIGQTMTESTLLATVEKAVSRAYDAAITAGELTDAEARERISEADYVFAVWREPLTAKGYGELTIKGFGIVERRLAAAKPGDALELSVDAFLCATEAEAYAYLQILGDEGSKAKAPEPSHKVVPFRRPASRP